jgi:rubrerythrin
MAARIDFSRLTLMDTLDLASLIEREAHERYTLFARQLGTGYADDAGSVFQSMAENEKKHGDELAQRRRALYGDRPATVSPDDLFDVEAPDVGAAHRNMSVFNAFQVALHAEQKAFAFYDRALRTVTQPEVRALFEELRDEEAEHVRMVEAIIAKLPPSAKITVEDLDDTSARMGY